MTLDEARKDLHTGKVVRRRSWPAGDCWFLEWWETPATLTGYVSGRFIQNWEPEGDDLLGDDWIVRGA